MSKRKLAFLFVCAATLVSCNESVDWDSSKPSSCLNEGEKTCGNGAVMICTDGEYVEFEKCTADKPVCDPATLTCIAQQQVTCTPGCSGNVLTTCDAAGNPSTTTCSGDTPVCGNGADGKPACIAGTPTTCTPGCNGNVLTTCDESGNATTKNCEDDSLVCGKDASGNDACVAASACVPGCDGTVLVVCNEDGSQDVDNTRDCALESLVCGKNESDEDDCIEGEPAECVPGCDGTTLVVCKEDGSRDDELTKDCADDSLVCGQDAEGNPACVEGGAVVKCTYGESENAIELDVEDTVCDENGKILTCQEDGTMSEATDCPEAKPICRPDSETSPVGSCVEYNSCTIGEGAGAVTIKHGEKGCDADKAKVLICNDGVLGDDDTCDTAAGEACVLGASGYACDTYDPAKDCKDASDNVIKEGSKLCSADGLKIEACNAAALAPVTEDQCEAAQVCRVVSDVPTCVKSYTTIKAIKDDFDAIKAAGSAGLVCSIDVAGVVTATRKNSSNVVQNLFFQDGSSVASDQAAGLYLYNSAGGLDSAVADNIKVVAAKVMVYNGQLEIVDATVTKTTATDTVTPAEITDISTILETTEDAKNARNLMLVTVKNVTTDGTLITDSGNHSINVSTYIAKDLVKKDDVFKYDITGIVNFNKSASNTIEKANGLAPRTADDLVKVGCIDEDLTFTPASGSTPESCELQEGGACSTPNAVRCDPATNQFHKCTSIGYWGPATACSAFEGLNNANASTFACNDAKDGCVITACEGDNYQLNENKLSCDIVGTPCGKDMNGTTITGTTYFCVDSKHVALCEDGYLGEEVTWSGCDTDGKICNPETIDAKYGICDDDPGYCTKDICTAGNIQKCEGGTLAAEAPCDGITNAKTYGCNTAGDKCTVTECNGDLVPNSEGTACVEKDKAACSYGGVEVAHGDVGCKSDTVLSLCDDGKWDTTADETCILGCNVSGKACSVCSTTGYICVGDLWVDCKADVKPTDSDFIKCSDADHCKDGFGCVECINDADCASVEGKSACNTSTYTCEPAKCDFEGGKIDHGIYVCTGTATVGNCENGKIVDYTDLTDHCKSGYTCDPATVNAQADCTIAPSTPEPEWETIVEGPEKYIGGKAVADSACTDEAKPYMQKCGAEYSNVGPTTASNTLACVNVETVSICALNADTNPSVIGTTASNVNANGYLKLNQTSPGWDTDDDPHKVYLKYSLADKDLSGKTALKVSFEYKRDDDASPKKLSVTAYSGDTKLKEYIEDITDKSTHKIVAELNDLSSVSDLNVRIAPYDTTVTKKAVLIYPITIEAK